MTHYILLLWQTTTTPTCRPKKPQDQFYRTRYSQILLWQVPLVALNKHTQHRPSVGAAVGTQDQIFAPGRTPVHFSKMLGQHVNRHLPHHAERV
jgi:hypothetical protein